MDIVAKLRDFFARPLKSTIKARGHYEFKLVRDGKVIDEWEIDNLVVNQGLNDILSVYFNSGSQKTSWFMGLFQGNYAPVLTDTAANWSANATESSQYSNPTLYGIALISNNVIGGTAGTLVSEATFAAPKAVSTSDQLLVTYSMTLTG